MGVLALVDATILAGSADLTGQSNEVGLNAEAESLEATVFGQGGWRSRVGGLRSGDASVKGYFAAGDLSLPDDSLFANLGSRGVPVSISPVLPAVGGLAYLMKVMRGTYKWGSQVGALIPFEAGAMSDGAVVRGAYGATGAKTATGTGAAVNLGAVPTGFKLYAALHVIAVSGTGGPTLTVSVQSDDASGMPSPVTRGTFAVASGISSQWLEVPSPGAGETWWRVSHTITGTTPSFLFHVTFGIGPA